MFEAVRAYPDGDSTPARFALTATELGYAGIVLRLPPDQAGSIDPAPIESAYNIPVIPGIEISTASPASASGLLGTYRPSTPILLLRGGTTALNNFAIRQHKIDVLTQPLADNATVDHVTIKTATDHNVALEITLGQILRTTGGNRVRALKNTRKLWDLIDNYDAPYVVSVTPRSHRYLRAPRDLAAVGDLIGIPHDAITTGLAAWGEIIARNEKRLGTDHIEPGITRGKHTDTP